MVKSAISLLAGTLFLVLLVRSAGNFLVVQRLHKADVILVLAGDTNDVRFWRGIELLRTGYGPQLLVDAREDSKVFGQTDLDRARQFIQTGLDLSARVDVCPVHGESTQEEAEYVRRCLGDASASSVLLVTSDYETRRTVSTFQKRLPQHTWYVATATDPTRFGTSWWEHREWTKTAVIEWEKLLWWELVDRWR